MSDEIAGHVLSDIELTIANIELIIKEPRRDDLSFAEKAGLYAAIDVISRDVDKHIAEECGGDSYALEKMLKTRWHVGAALGFDVTNNHTVDQHRSWAFGQFSTLRDKLREQQERRKNS